IQAGTSKIVSFNCRNTGNVTLTGLRWENVDLAGPGTIAGVNASFPPSELFSIPAGATFTRQIELFVPAATTYGSYESIPNHFWLWADMPVNNVRDAGEASCSFKVSCEVGDLLIDIVESSLDVSGAPNNTSTVKTLTAKNTGSMALGNIKATGSVLIPTVAGPINIPATCNVFSPASIGGANAGQQRTSNWSVNIPANASAGVYIATATVWEDANNNNLKDTGEAYSECPIQLTVLAMPAIDITTTQLNLGWTAKSSSKSGQIEIRNVGNVNLNAVYPLKSALVFGANNIPVASITFQTIPAMPFTLDVGQSKIATVTVTIGPVQASAEYTGSQRIFEDHVTVNGVWDPTEVFDTFDLVISVGNKVLYETAVGNPPLDCLSRAVNGNYSVPVTVYSGSQVPLDRVRCKVITPFTSSTYTFPVASLTFTPAGSQSIPGLSNCSFQANIEVGFVNAGSYVATAAFYDDTDNDQVIDSVVPNIEASATFQLLLTVNPVDGVDILASDIDFGSIAVGSSKTVEIGFRNTGNANIDTADLSWSFSDIASLSNPAEFVPWNGLDVVGYLSTPVLPGGYGTATVRLFIPVGQKKGLYGSSGPQKLKKGLSEDPCTFRVEVGGSNAANVEPRSIYQDIATETFEAQSPPATDLYFLSAWVCPGSGSADIAFIQYDKDGMPVATVSVGVDQAGQLTRVDSPSFPIKYAGIAEQFPFACDGLTYQYCRIYLAFNLTFDSLTASSTRLILHNSSGVAGRPVWFDGIKLERAFNGQLKPTAYHPKTTLHSPSKGESMKGGKLYYEW
ncbi:MAG TPA: hypothetical protein PKM25_08610, partial [Candidatus Ozemobacteraceae bacterium]|nr:hypothetical protein [Candidatus Ozemobacteraceae bacterium]